MAAALLVGLPYMFIIMGGGREEGKDGEIAIWAAAQAAPAAADA